MKDRELTRLLQTHPEEGLEAAMLAYAPLVKAVLNRILPQNPCDRRNAWPMSLFRSGAMRPSWSAPQHRCGRGSLSRAQQGHRPLQRPAPPRGTLAG